MGFAASLMYNSFALNLAVAIGDFGLGSDAPLMLDYWRSPESPCVLRLQWSQDGNQWIKVSDSFDEFVAISGLASASPRFREQSGRVAGIGASSRSPGKCDPLEDQPSY